MSKRPKALGRKDFSEPVGYLYTPSRFGETHQANAGEIRLFGDMPTVIFSEVAWRTMRSFIDLIDTEVGWLGTVTRTGDRFYIDAVYLVEQEVSSVETLITEAGFNRLMVELLAETANDPVAARVLVDATADSEALNDVMGLLVENYGCDMGSITTRGNTIRFWGHSHVNMTVHPSGPDDKAMESFQDQGFSFMLRGIFNKQGDVRIDLFDYDRRMMVLSIPYQIRWEGVSDNAAIVAEIALKVRKKVYPTTYSKHTTFSHWRGVEGQDFTEQGDDLTDYSVKPPLTPHSIRGVLHGCRARGGDLSTTLQEFGLEVDDAGNVYQKESGEIILPDFFEPLVQI